MITLNHKISKNQLRALKLKPLVFLLFLSFSYFLSAATIYIDPDASHSDEDGSITKPFNSWADVTWTSGNTYLQKRGTTWDYNSGELVVGASNVTLGAYGSGAKPKMTIDGGTYGLVISGKNNVTLQDLDIQSETTSSVLILKGDMSGHVIKRCDIHNSIWGIRLYNGGSNILIDSCEIYDTYDDGIYSLGITEVEISNNYIHDVNLRWLDEDNPDQGGDCIQFSGGCDNFYVHHNVLDRSDNGNKFCFIAQSDGDDGGIFEYNHCIGTHNNISTVYVKSESDGMIFRYNTFETGSYGIFVAADSKNMEIYYNTFNDFTYSGVRFAGYNNTAEIYNNTFYDNAIGIRNSSKSTTELDIKNNIFYKTSDSQTDRSDLGAGESDYNLFYPSSTASNEGSHSIEANPLFVNASIGNFKLLNSESKAINNGVDVDLDFDMASHSIIGNTDIGAFEYNSDTTSVSVSTPDSTESEDDVDSGDTDSGSTDTNTDTGSEDTDGSGSTTPEKENTPPVVDIKYQTGTYKGMTLTLDASETYDEDNDSLSFSWDIPEGVIANSTDSSTIEIIPTAEAETATSQITLLVSDGIDTVSNEIDLDIQDYNPEAEELKIISLIASDYQEGNIPEYIADGDTTTRWSIEGDNQYIIFELEEFSSLSHFEVYFLNGEIRLAYFDVYASSDGNEWELILDNSVSCGFSSKLQTFVTPETKASNDYKYIKLVGHMNSLNAWNAFNEFTIYGFKDTDETSANDIIDINDIVEVFPNPATEVVYVNSTDNSEIRVLNAKGQVLLEQQSEVAGTYQLDYSFTPGIYVIQIIQDNNSITSKRLIVK